MAGGDGEKGERGGGLQVDMGSELILHGYSMCNCLEVSGIFKMARTWAKGVWRGVERVGKEGSGESDT